MKSGEKKQKKQKTWSEADLMSLKREYLAGEGLTGLVKRYGMSPSWIFEKAKKEGWAEERKKIREKAAQLAMEEATNDVAETIKRAKCLQGRLLDKIETMIEALPGEATERKTGRIEADEEGRSVTVQNIIRLRDIAATLKEIAEQQTVITDRPGGPIYDLIRRIDEEAGAC